MNLMKCALALVLFLSVMALPALGASNVPGDINGDNIVSAEEVAAAEKLAKEGKLSSDELQEIKHIHEKYPINITDSANRTVTIYKPVKRIIAQNWADEPIFILGAQDKISAMTSNAQTRYSFIPGVSEKPTIGLYREVDYEKVVENQPDLYIVSSNKTIGELEKRLGSLGTTIVVFRFAEINTFEKEFRALAHLLEKDDKAEKYLSWWQGYLDQIHEKIAKNEKKLRVYNEYSDTPWGTGSKTSGIDNLITLAGGFNIASTLNTSYYAEVSPEWVLQQNPEMIIIPAFVDFAPTDLTGYHINSTENARKFIEEASNKTGWKETDAVRDHRVFVLDGYIGSASYRGVIGVCYCAKWFYPEIFKDLDPEAIHKEYFEKWLGVPYKGIWAYPQAS